MPARKEKGGAAGRKQAACRLALSSRREGDRHAERDGWLALEALRLLRTAGAHLPLTRIALTAAGP